LAAKLALALADAIQVVHGWCGLSHLDRCTAATTVASWRQGKGRTQAARSPSVCGAAIQKALPEQQDSGLRAVSGA